MSLIVAAKALTVKNAVIINTVMAYFLISASFGLFEDIVILYRTFAAKAKK
jgi:hypothetical protein